MSGRGGTTPFDRLLKQQCNKGVSAGKSAGVVGKWGAASFTSLRGANTNANANANGAVATKRVNKFFKSRTVQKEDNGDDDGYGGDVVTPINPAEPVKLPQKRRATESTNLHNSNAFTAAAVAKPKRFFTSKKAKQDPTPSPPPPVAQPCNTESEPESEPETEPEPEPESDPEPEVVPEPELEQPKIRPLKLRIKTGQMEQFKVVHSSSESEGRSRASSIEADAEVNYAEEEEEEEEDDTEPEEPTITAAVLQPEPPKVRSYSRSTRRTVAAPKETFVTAVQEVVPEEDELVTSAPQRIPNPEERIPTPPDEPQEPIPVSRPNRFFTSKKTLNAVSEEPPRPPSRTTSSTYGSRRVEQEHLLQRVVTPDEPAREVTPPTPPLAVPSPPPPEAVPQTSKSLKDDWGDDEDNSDPEISFKDDSLVMKSPSPPGKETELKRAATVATSSNLSKELDGLAKNDGATAGGSQPMEVPAVTAGPRKQRSIFKSRDPKAKKGMSLYRHNWQQNQDEFKEEVFNRAVFGGGDPRKAAPAASNTLDFPDSEFDAPPTTSASFASSKLTRVASSTSKGTLDETSVEVTSVKCDKAQKDYYTVIKNVKKGYQIQESGEFQEFNDDVDYILGGLGVTNSLSTRCLSTVTLASKCMEPSFRMHLRAHGTVTQFFAELRDAPQNASLALCASTVLFVLSQDRLNMDLDRDSLELMLNLLDTDSRIKDALDGSGMNKRELEKNKQKVRDLVSAMKVKGHATNLNVDHITADHLSMETLLSLTSKRAGEWFKEELRDLGGLDHLVRTLSECVAYLTADEITMWTEPLQNKLKKADRVLKVLENVTHENEENCTYLLHYKSGEFLGLIHSMYKLLDDEVSLNPSLNVQDKETMSFTLREALFDCMRVYINLVHDYHQQPVGSALAGEKSGIFDAILHCLFVVPDLIPFEKRFDVHVLALTMMINMVENCVANRKHLMRCLLPTKPDVFLSDSERSTAPQGLVGLFMSKEEEARNEESKTDNILDGVKNEDDDEEKKEEEKTQEERIDDTVAKLLHKAGRHMEDTLIASYVTLIIGYLIIEDKEHESMMREYLPDHKFELMVSVLKKFFNFMNLTASSSVTSSRGLKATEMIINHLEKIDKPEAPKVKPENDEESFGDLTLFDMSKDEDEDTTTLMEDEEED